MGFERFRQIFPRTIFYPVVNEPVVIIPSKVINNGKWGGAVLLDLTTVQDNDNLINLLVTRQVKPRFCSKVVNIYNMS